MRQYLRKYVNETSDSERSGIFAVLFGKYNKPLAEISFSDDENPFIKMNDMLAKYPETKKFHVCVADFGSVFDVTERPIRAKNLASVMEPKNQVA